MRIQSIDFADMMIMTVVRNRQQIGQHDLWLHNTRESPGVLTQSSGVRRQAIAIGIAIGIVIGIGIGRLAGRREHRRVNFGTLVPASGCRDRWRTRGVAEDPDGQRAMASLVQQAR